MYSKQDMADIEAAQGIYAKINTETRPALLQYMHHY